MSESNLEVAPYMTGAKKVEADEQTTEKKKCTSFIRCYAMAIALVLVSFSFVIVASFFGDEYRTVVASFDSILSDDEVVVEALDSAQDVVAVDEILISEEPAQVEQFVQASVVQPESSYAYQPFIVPVQNNAFFDIQQRQRAAHDEAMRQQNARIAEMNEFRNASFQRMEQDRIERLNRQEAMHTKTLAIQQEMQQKMQQAYDDFHSI